MPCYLIYVISYKYYAESHNILHQRRVMYALLPNLRHQLSIMDAQALIYIILCVSDIFS